ncbi:MAG: radical SAM family heme chaperone HemW [Desulfotalea sp.]
MSSLYIHIPFCLSKCYYCAFTSFVGREKLYQTYKDALIKELENIANTKTISRIETIFFGGGTPTVLPAQYLTEILGTALNLWGISKDAEISLEANPETVNKDLLEQLHIGGFNRISFGVQSMNNNELKKIGRIHTRNKVAQSVQEARLVGFKSINIDLMSGLPEQSLSDWQVNLQDVLSIKPDHLSIYQLTPEDGTIFAKQLADDKYHLPSDELSLAMDKLSESLTSEAGFSQYEISNYSLTNHECRHNINYWHNNDYIGVGAGAVSYMDGLRESRVLDPQDYINKITAGYSVIESTEKLDREESFRETMIMGLRLLEGVELNRLEKRFNIEPEKYYAPILEKYQKYGMMSIENGFLSITSKGRSLSNMIMADFV